MEKPFNQNVQSRELQRRSLMVEQWQMVPVHVSSEAETERKCGVARSFRVDLLFREHLELVFYTVRVPHSDREWVVISGGWPAGPLGVRLRFGKPPLYFEHEVIDVDNVERTKFAVQVSRSEP